MNDFMHNWNKLEVGELYNCVAPHNEFYYKIERRLFGITKLGTVGMVIFLGLELFSDGDPYNPLKQLVLLKCYSVDLQKTICAIIYAIDYAVNEETIFHDLVYYFKPADWKP